MDFSAASAYVYAKAGGLLSKSFVGKKTAKLFSVKSLRDLYALLFSGEIPSIPESLLAKEIETKAEKQFLNQYIDLIQNFSNPSKILVSLLNFYDYDNVKEIGAALSFGETEIPELYDIKRFSKMNYKAWPNIQKITEKSSISWYNKAVDVSELHLVDSKIDSQYIKEIWDCISKLSSDDKSDISHLIKSEISYMNILWVLRLKVYYKMNPDEIKEKLAFENPSLKKRDELAGEALSILEKDVGSFDDWKNWKYKKHLNPHEDGVVWEIDPTFVEKSFKRDLSEMAIRSFHKRPMSVLSFVAWFKIKQNELDNIRAVAEGLRLDLDSEKLMDAAGFLATKN